jgi:multidrug efflux pump subunit AcrA (membrane-fusion protein)
MVPVSAIRTEGDINKVYVIEAGAARERIVQIGLLENDMIQVKTGVNENEIVATGGVGDLFDGVLVRQMN